MYKKIVFKIVGLELLLIFFYTVNGAFVTIKEPTSPYLQFVMLVPLAIILFLYIAFKKKWRQYFFVKVHLNKESLLLYAPLILVLCIILFSTNGLNFVSVPNLFAMFIMQLLIVAFIEETVFRGMMLRIISAKGTFTAVWISSILFGVTHSLQLIGGQSVEDTIIQILYALVVGLVLALLVMDGQSIIITILFHGLNNFFNFMGNVESSITSAYIIFFVLLVYSIFLWKRVKNKGKTYSSVPLGSLAK
ncbi:abortive phage infection protein [Viridibacillus sp. FSL H7-0596]|uniref:CPBP family intramembrane glutamic endopeptidase n=1 Tax=Viridibacillus sp. FSL H7-0596 TaxID=1928923 RepID=UPI00096ED386|nr:CPBP family intramembrane glutamic endopeptidase [Viridibacillus sp. FSL H7-0596]OMC86568.1 abortive phage infection protein [Viridibacillus sp. FSL H7-0596]